MKPAGRVTLEMLVGSYDALPEGREMQKRRDAILRHCVYILQSYGYTADDVAEVLNEKPVDQQPLEVK